MQTEQQYWYGKLRQWQTAHCPHCGAYGVIVSALEWDTVETITVEAKCVNCNRVKGAGAWPQPQAQS